MPMSSRPSWRRHLVKGSKSKRASKPGRCDRLLLEVYDDLRCGVRLGQFDQPLNLLLGERHREEPDLGAVGVEDVGERGGDDGAEAPVLKPPWCVLARRAAPEVGAGDEDARPGSTAGLLRKNSGSCWPSDKRRQSQKRNSPYPVRSTLLRNCLGMIWSVSTLARARAASVPVMVRTGSITPPRSGIGSATRRSR